MHVAFASFSNIGPRTSNQDCILRPVANAANYCVAAIADGVGGEAGGAEAAEIAIGSAAKITNNPSEIPTAFKAAVEAMRAKAQLDTNLTKMATTLTVGLLFEQTLFVGHVGDTRIHHLRGTGLNTLTTDHTEVAALQRKGILTEKQAKRYPRRNVLLSSLNLVGDYEIQLNQAPLQIGDRILFTTDGVHGRVKRGAILNSSVEHTDLSAFVADIERRTVATAPSDNFSALGLEILGW